MDAASVDVVEVAAAAEEALVDEIETPAGVETALGMNGGLTPNAGQSFVAHAFRYS